ncbi:MAG: polysaccharide deacetylase family protein [Saprospiraceae bacterium]|nr:polysaccharide deacetylase family protein [Saprospiraceae bacterium]
MYLVKTPSLIQNLFPNFIWKFAAKEKKIYLTFDDGPIPEVTPWVLEQLAQYGAKATFFCVGENVSNYANVYNRIIEEGHAVGSHTNNHLSGWGTDNIPYFHNVRRGATLVKSDLFRPPYGRIKPSQVPFLMRHYKIIMWDVLSGDFDPNLTNEQCLSNVMANTDQGSIVVFHDSLKAEEKLKYVLPKVLAAFKDRGFEFASISQDDLQPSRLMKKIA